MYVAMYLLYVRICAYTYMHLHTYIGSLCCDDIIARAWQQKVLRYLCTKLMQIMLYVTIKTFNKDKNC